KDLDPGLPADWSPFQFLVLELRLSSPQRFDLRIHDAGGVRSVRLAPVPGAWIRSAVPLSFLTQAARSGNDLASVHNKARPMMFINLSGTPGELKSVREIGVVMANPIGAPSLEIRSVKLSNQDPGDALLDGKPLVDQFGQWMGDDWPGKATSLEQLQGAWAAEEKALGKGDFAYCRWRLRRLESQSHGLLPRGKDRRQVVVRGSRRASVPLAGRRFHGHLGNNFHPGARATVRRPAAHGDLGRPWRRARRRVL